MRKPLFSILLTSTLLGGCAVGPDFKSPAPPAVTAYQAAPLRTAIAGPPTLGGEPQSLLAGVDIPAQWWVLFRSPSLNALVKRSLANNPDLKAAEAALSVARENGLAQQSAIFPGISASMSASRQKTAAELSPTPNSGALYFSLFTPQVSVSYVPDVFGLNRRTIEALNAQAEQSRFALMAARISLTTNVVTTAVQMATSQAQIDTTRELIAANEGMLSILQRQHAKGYVSVLDVAAQESQLAQARATLPVLQKQLEQQRDVLIALTGGYPEQGLPENIALSDLHLPEKLPGSLPSKLVEHRPDILQAEENLHAASAQIGVAVANRLPNLNLTASAGSSSLSAGRIFAPGTGFWSLGADIAQPIFDGGALAHKERAARAAFEQAREQYRSTVLTAFQNVADTLSALQHDAEVLKSATAAASAAEKTLGILQRQAKGGYATNLALSNAEVAYQQAVLTVIQARAARYADTAALFQALGGGWWNVQNTESVQQASPVETFPILNLR